MKSSERTSDEAATIEEGTDPSKNSENVVVTK